MVDLQKLKETQLEIMDAIHELCSINGIRYYLIGGSCLGAIRHKGFIPWDADIDIAMPREDYDRFFENIVYKLPSKFIAHTYKTDKIFAKSHALVCMKNTVLLTKADIRNPQVPKFGVYVDVMPLDKCPDDYNLQQKQKKDYLFIKKIRYYKLSRIYPTNGIITRVLKHMMRFLFAPLSVQKINRWQEKVMKRYSNLETCNYWCSIASKYKYEKQLMDKRIYGTPQLTAFENRMYYIPERTHEYLTKLYGDYMRLPSKAEQNVMYNYFEVFKLNN